MKKTLAIFLLIAFAIPATGQVLDSAQAVSRNDLLLKSKKQRNTGFLMLGVGAAAVTGGYFLFKADWNGEVEYDGSEEDEGIKDGAGMVLIGALLMVGSIAEFSASGRNKKKAMAMTAGIKVDKVVPDGVFKTHSTYYPALSVKFSIR
jgi:hypothetical protein